MYYVFVLACFGTFWSNYEHSVAYTDPQSGERNVLMFFMISDDGSNSNICVCGTCFTEYRSCLLTRVSRVAMYFLSVNFNTSAGTCNLMCACIANKGITQRLILWRLWFGQAYKRYDEIRDLDKTRV